MKKKLARLILTLGLVLIFVGVYLIKKDDIYAFIESYIFNKKEVELGEVNAYYRDYDFNYVQNTNNFSPTSKQDIYNIFYTVLNSGRTEFTFYCPTEYKDCTKEVNNLINDQEALSDINNYVHPYNGFSHIESEYDTIGRVTINIVRNYSEEDISLINNKIQELLPQLTNQNNSDYDNIKNIHDYIINNTKYDSDRTDNNIIKYKSDTAYGPLFEGYAICGGYTDLMELFLEQLNIKSFKVSSDNHIWNAVYIDNNWKHLDLTWDDPVASNGLDYLEYNYFIINTDTLLSIETTQHIFNREHYSEIN